MSSLCLSLRSQLSIEATVKKAEEQLKLAKKNLITDLNKHYDKGQVRLVRNSPV